MSTIIKAIFGSPDYADNALATIRRSGLNIRAYKAVPIEMQDESDRGYVIPAMNTNPIFLGATATSTMPVGVAFTSITEDNRRALMDSQSTEVIINITVDDEQAEAVEAALISMGGRQVRVV